MRAYTPYLSRLNLTYTQYIAMMVMWERERVLLKEAGEELRLDSSTLTPVFKRLEEKGFVARSRSEDDGRDVVLTLTDSGRELREKALRVPERLAACVRLSPEEAGALYAVLYKLMANLRGVGSGSPESAGNGPPEGAGMGVSKGTWNKVPENTGNRAPENALSGISEVAGNRAPERVGNGPPEGAGSGGAFLMGRTERRLYSVTFLPEHRSPIARLPPGGVGSAYAAP